MTFTIDWPVPTDPTGEEGEYTIEGKVSYDPGTPRSYASGGSPDGWDIDDITVTDWDGNDVTAQMMAIPAFAQAVEWRLVDEAEEARRW